MFEKTVWGKKKILLIAQNYTHCPKMIVNEPNLLPLKWQMKTQLTIQIQKLSQVTNEK